MIPFSGKIPGGGWRLPTAVMLLYPRTRITFLDLGSFVVVDFVRSPLFDVMDFWRRPLRFEKVIGPALSPL